MKAVRSNEYGGTDVMRVVEIEAPHAGPGKVRIAVRAAGVNPIDWKLRAGYVHDFMPLTFPAGVGSEAAGIVDEVGAGVSGVAIGDPVFGYGQNTVAEHAVLKSWGTRTGQHANQGGRWPVGHRRNCYAHSRSRQPQGR